MGHAEHYNKYSQSQCPKCFLCIIAKVRSKYIQDLICFSMCTDQGPINYLLTRAIRCTPTCNTEKIQGTSH